MAGFYSNENNEQKRIARPSPLFKSKTKSCTFKLNYKTVILFRLSTTFVSYTPGQIFYLFS